MIPTAPKNRISEGKTPFNAGFSRCAILRWLEIVLIILTVESLSKRHRPSLRNRTLNPIPHSKGFQISLAPRECVCKNTLVMPQVYAFLL